MRSPVARVIYSLSGASICTGFAFGLIALSAYFDRHGIGFFLGRPVDSGAYELFLATEAGGLGILFGIYFAVHAVFASRDPQLGLERLANWIWAVPGTLMIYVVGLLAAAGFHFDPYHGVFPVVASLDVLSLAAFATMLFGLLPP